jgi:hypothetical protein
MKLQVQHGSFGRILAAAAAIAFMFSLASPTQAQQGQWGADHCLYAPSQRGQWVRQGCVLSSGGSQYYHDDATKVFRDLRTNISYFQGQDGRLLILTSSGWMDAQAYLEMVRKNRATYGGDGTRGAGNYRPGMPGVVGGTSPSVTGYPQIDSLINTMNTNIARTWTTPDNMTWVPAR